MKSIMIANPNTTYGGFIMSKARVSGTFKLERVMLGKPDEISGIKYLGRDSVRVSTRQGQGNHVPGMTLSFDGALACPNHECTYMQKTHIILCSFSGHSIKTPFMVTRPISLAEHQKKWETDQTAAGQLHPSAVIQKIRDVKLKFHPFEETLLITKLVMGGRSDGFSLPAYAFCRQCGVVYADCVDIQTDFFRLYDDYIRTLTEELIPSSWEEDKSFRVRPEGGEWQTPAWIEDMLRYEKYQTQNPKGFQAK